jgi:signal recognition particle subunit SEC65
MTLSPLRIDFVSIKAKESAFDPTQEKAQIEALANSISDLGGLVHIPVVKQITIDEYELISGYLEYYAYRKAREVNPRLSEQIEVFIADSKNHSVIQKQLEILQSIEGTKVAQSSKSVTTTSSELDLRIGNIESSVKNNHKAVIDEIAQLKTELLQEITAQLPKPIPPLEAFNRIVEPEIAYKVQRRLEFLGAGKAKKAVELLQEVSRNKKQKPFQSFAEVIDALKVPQKKGSPRKLISDQKMLALIDRWND